MAGTSKAHKVDLHVHSSHSDRPYSWFLRSTGAAECYTAVDQAYAIARRRGMDLVTLADHDVIDGALALCERHPGDTFVSVEVSARFPEDGCIVHVICVDVTEAQHRELQRLRRDVYELVAYLDEARIAHFWAHPLSQVNGRLRREHLERGLLMFRALETRNGTRDVTHEHRLHEVTAGISVAQLARWAERYPRAPWINRDARYHMVGGSDDHGTLAIARAYTVFEGEASGAGVADALRGGRTAAGGEAGTGTTLAHNCYGVLAGFLQHSGQVELASSARRAAPPLDHDHAHDHAPTTEAAAAPPAPSPAPSLLEALIAARSGPTQPGTMADRLWASGHLTPAQELIRVHAERALVDTWRRALGGIIEPAALGRVGDAADGLPALVKALALELPYLLAHRYNVRDRRGADRFAAELGAGRAGNPRPRVAVFTDTIDHVNGVAIGLRRLLGEARRGGLDLRLIGCGPVARLETDADGVVRLPSVYDHRLAEYPEMAWSVPHLPPLLRYLEEEQIDLVQCSTPGPVGLAALAAARLTGLPVIGQYHTDVPEYALRLTGDPTAAALVRQLVGWFYRAMDRVLAPTAWVAEIVKGLGVAPEKLVQVPRGVDLALFSPSRRRPGAFGELGVTGPVLLYVGRLSREKSLDHLFTAFRAVRAEVSEASLVLVGDGPQRAELERDAPPGCVFTGFVTGDALAELYASADVFVFPSDTETFGNAVVEAQASGLPAIVAERGATREHVVDGITGFAIDPRNVDTMRRTLVRLLRDPDLARRMGRAAVQHAARYDLGDALRGTFRCYGRILDEVTPRPRPEAVPDRELVA